jgi:transcriptional regulator with XRE-family HTH domain
MARGRRRSRAAAVLIGRERAGADARRLGSAVDAARRRRDWTLQQLGDRVGLTGQRVGQIAAGLGAGASLEVWHAIAAAIGVPLRIDLGRDAQETTADAGHLAIQELVIRLGRMTGRTRTFELPTRPSSPSYSTDVGLRDDALRVLMLVECWNTFGDIGAAVRSTRRKLAEADAMAVVAGGDRMPYRVAGCWVVRDTRRNRSLVTRYPELFGSTFVGSSVGWARALTRPGLQPPDGLGLVWCDSSASRLFAWRKPG